MRIALLEDDDDIARLEQLWLENEGHDCVRYALGQDLIKALGRESFDMLILDWMLPDVSGIEVLQWTREHLDWRIPILFVTQRDSEEDIVHALSNGADDYMTKPMRQMEMLARVGALARRSPGAQEDNQTLHIPPFTIDMKSRTIAAGEQLIDLTQKEFDLAVFMFRHLGRILSRGHILESVWGQPSQISTRTVDTHISRVRNKLTLNKESGWRLSAVYQHGYRLERLD